jgi:hypothetical protein
MLLKNLTFKELAEDKKPQTIEKPYFIFIFRTIEPAIEQIF